MKSLGQRMVFVDLELVGRETARRIIQVAAIALDCDLDELEAFEAKLRFDRRRADHRSRARLRDCQQTWRIQARPAREVACDFVRFIRRHATIKRMASDGSGDWSAQLVMHNATVDGPVLQRWLEWSGEPVPGTDRPLCLTQRACWLFQEQQNLTPPIDFQLGTLCNYFNLPLNDETAFNALARLRTTVELYRRMSLLEAAQCASRTF